MLAQARSVGLEAVVGYDLAQQQPQADTSLGGLRECLDRGRLVVILDAHAAHRLVLQGVRLLVHQGLRNVQGIGRQQRFHDLLADVVLDLLLRFTLHVLTDVLDELLKTALGDVEHRRELLVEFRQNAFFDTMCLDREVRFLAREILGVIVLRELDLEGLFVAGLDAFQPFLEIGQHLPLAENNGNLGALPARECLAIEFAGEVDDHAIAILALAVDGPPCRLLHTQVGQHAVDVVVTDLHVRPLDLDLVEILELDLRHDFEGGDIGKRVTVLTLGLDLRPPGRVQVLLHDGIGIALLQNFADHFLANLLAVALFDDFRRDLAGAKSLDLGGPTHASQARFNLLLDGSKRQLDAHAAFESAGRLDGDVHSLNSLKN